MMKGKLRRALDYAGTMAWFWGLAPVAAVARRTLPSMKRLWLVMERGNDARDNGYWFYRYLRTAHPEVNARYVISDDSPDRDRLSPLGGTVRFGSLRHKLMYLCADVLAGTHVYPAAPDLMAFYHLAPHGIRARGRQVFLQHGITKDEMAWLHGESLPLDLFICGAAPEYIFIRDSFGHREGVARYLGFCRFDHLLTAKAPRRDILLMPTWRGSHYPSRRDFPGTAFYRHYQALLNSPELHALLEEADCRLVFYPHIELQRELHHFSSDSERVVLADYRSYDVQELLMNSALLITDYSSVYFDVAYLDRPVIYDQFDEAEFRKYHYQKGYFDYDRDGFGPVCRTERELLDQLRACVQREFAVETQYRERAQHFFPLRDQNNCQRTYEAILSLKQP